MNTRIPSDEAPDFAREPSAANQKSAATAAAESALGWDDVGLESPEFARFSPPESSSLLAADIEDASAQSSPEKASKTPFFGPGQPIVGTLVELLVKGSANAVWAVVGLVLWIPLLARTLVLSVAGIVHGALTGQNPLTVPIRIREASRFYTGQFLTADSGEQKAGIRRRFRPTRLLFEIAWAAVFYSGLLALAGVIDVPLQQARDTLTSAWSRFATFASEQVSEGSGWAALAWQKAPADLQAILDLGPIVWVAFAISGLFCVALGWLIGSRSR